MNTQNNQLTTEQPKVKSPLAEFRDALMSTTMIDQLRTVLPENVTPERFARVVITGIQVAATNGTDLLSCNRQTLWAACMRAAQTGLLPDGREAALVKYGDSVQFLPMVEGYMKLVRNSGEIAKISVQVVYKEDEFDYELGDNERIMHKPSLGARTQVAGVYSIVTFTNGEKSREVMSVDEIEAIRARSRSGNKGPWLSDYAEMARKTVFRRHYKRLPKSTDLDPVMAEDDEVNGILRKEQEPAPARPATPGDRPSRLQAVVDQVQADQPAAPPAKVDLPDIAPQVKPQQNEEII